MKKCAWCGKMFWPTRHLRQGCSKLHQEMVDGANAVLKRDLEKEKNLEEKYTIGETGKKKSQDIKNTTNYTEKINSKENESITTPTRRDLMQNEQNAREEIQKGQDNIKENITEKIEENFLIKLESEDSQETLPVDFSPIFIDLKKANYHSKNLLDDSVKHLFVLMKGLTHDQADFDIKRVECHKVESAVKCASEIRNLLKLKLDIFKVAKDLK